MDDRTDFRTRTIHAKPSQVFAAMRDPASVARWWGPDGFRSTLHEFEFRVGATWRMTLHAPDGSDYPNEYRVMRIEPDRLLQVEHPSKDHYFVLTIELAPEGEGTRASWTQQFDSADHYRELAGFLAIANEQVLARLAAEAQAIDDLPPLPETPAGRYRHYKGGEYEVIGVARHSETLEPLVVYRPLYNASGLWVRPHAMFFETIEHEGVKRPRFERVG